MEQQHEPPKIFDTNTRLVLEEQVIALSNQLRLVGAESARKDVEMRRLRDQMLKPPMRSAIHEPEQENNNHDEEIRAMREQYEEKERKLRNCIAEIEDKKHEYEQMAKRCLSLEATFKNNINTVQERNKALNAELKQYQVTSDSLEEELKGARQREFKLKTQQVQLTQHISELRSKVESWQVVDSKTDKVRSLEEMYQHDTTKLSNEVSQLQSKLKEKDIDHKSMLALMASLEMENNALKDQVVTLKSDLTVQMKKEKQMSAKSRKNDVLYEQKISNLEDQIEWGAKTMKVQQELTDEYEQKLIAASKLERENADLIQKKQTAERKEIQDLTKQLNDLSSKLQLETENWNNERLSLKESLEELEQFKIHSSQLQVDVENLKHEKQIAVERSEKLANQVQTLKKEVKKREERLNDELNKVKCIEDELNSLKEREKFVIRERSELESHLAAQNDQMAAVEEERVYFQQKIYDLSSEIASHQKLIKRAKHLDDTNQELKRQRSHLLTEVWRVSEALLLANEDRESTIWRFHEQKSDVFVQPTPNQSDHELQMALDETLNLTKRSIELGETVQRMRSQSSDRPEEEVEPKLVKPKSPIVKRGRASELEIQLKAMGDEIKNLKYEKVAMKETMEEEVRRLVQKSSVMRKEVEQQHVELDKFQTVSEKTRSNIALYEQRIETLEQSKANLKDALEARENDPKPEQFKAMKDEFDRFKCEKEEEIRDLSQRLEIQRNQSDEVDQMKVALEKARDELKQSKEQQLVELDRFHTVSEKTRERIASYEKQIAILEKSEQSLKSALGARENEFQQLQCEEATVLKEKIKDLSQRLEQRQLQLEEFDHMKVALEKARDELKKSKEQQLVELDRFHTVSEKTRERIASYEKQIAILEESEQSLKSALGARENEFQQLQYEEKIKDLLQQLEQQQFQLEEFDQVKIKLEKTCNHLKQAEHQIVEFQKSMEEVKVEKDMLEERNEQLKQELMTLQLKITSIYEMSETTRIALDRHGKSEEMLKLQLEQLTSEKASLEAEAGSTLENLKRAERKVKELEESEQHLKLRVKSNEKQIAQLRGDLNQVADVHHDQMEQLKERLSESKRQDIQEMIETHQQNMSLARHADEKVEIQLKVAELRELEAKCVIENAIAIQNEVLLVLTDGYKSNEYWKHKYMRDIDRKTTFMRFLLKWRIATVCSKLRLEHEANLDEQLFIAHKSYIDELTRMRERLTPTEIK